MKQTISFAAQRPLRGWRCAGFAVMAALFSAMAVSAPAQDRLDDGAPEHSRPDHAPAPAKNRAAADGDAMADKIQNRLRDAAVRAGLGIEAVGNGQFTVRQPLNRELRVPADSRGEGLPEAALAWIDAEPAQFAGISAKELRLKRLHPIPLFAGESGMWWQVEFEQLCEGRPVEVAVLQVGIVDRVANQVCHVALVLGRVFPDLPAMPAPKLTRDQAWRRVLRAFPAPAEWLQIHREFQSVRVVDGQPVPVTHFQCGYAEKDFIVNELTGEITVESLLIHAIDITVQATVNMENHNPATLTPATPMPDVLVDYGSGTTYTDANGQASIPDGTSADIKLIGRHAHIVRMDAGPQQSQTVNANATVDFADSSEFPLAENIAYYHTDFVYKWLQTRVDTAVSNSFFDTFTMETQVNFNDVGNANFNSAGGTLNGGAQPRIRFFNGDATCRNTAMSDVIYHEYGHYIDWAMGGLATTGGLSEGWGDVIAMLITGDPELAEGLYTADDPATGNGIRNAQNNYIWNPSDQDHTAGTALSGFTWDTRQGFIALQGASNWNFAETPQERCEKVVLSALDANTTSMPDTITFISIFDIVNAGDSFSKGVITQAATNHGLQSYLAPDFHLLESWTLTAYIADSANDTVSTNIAVQNLTDAAKVFTATITEGATPVASGDSAPISPSMTGVFVVDWSAAALAPGFHTLTVTVTAAGSAHTPTADFMVYVGDAADQVVFADDFENGTGQWTLTGLWGLEANGSFHRLADSPDSKYASNTDATATSVNFSLEGIHGTTIVLFGGGATQPHWDYFDVEMSADGIDWFILEGFTGNHPQLPVVDASRFDGQLSVQLRLRLVSNNLFNNPGMAFDEIVVVGTPGVNIPPTTRIPIASDGFDTGDFTGGTGFSSSWFGFGGSIVVDDRPHAGTHHVRLPGNVSSSIFRFADLTGMDDARVRIFIVAYLGPNTAQVDFTDDFGANWISAATITTEYNGLSAASYHVVDVGLAEVGLVGTAGFGFAVSIANLVSTALFVYVDTVEIYRPNHAPVVAAVSNQSVAEGQPFSVNLSATDANAGQSVAFSTSTLPGWLSLTDNGDGTATLSGTPGFADSGTTTITVTATDNAPSPLAGQTAFDLTVTHVNIAPVLTVPGPQAVDMNMALLFTVTATDFDLDTLTLSATNLPTGATFDTSTGEFSWTPEHTAMSAVWYVTFSVTDGTATTTKTVRIEVYRTNLAPIFDYFDVHSIEADKRTVIVGIRATDPDLDPVSIDAVDLPAGVTFDAAKNELTIPASVAKPGTMLSFVMQASDGINPPTIQTFDVRVSADGTAGCAMGAESPGTGWLFALLAGVMLLTRVRRKMRRAELAVAA